MVLDTLDINLLHIILEVSTTACLLFLSYVNFSSARNGRYYSILGYGGMFAALANILHIVSVIIVPQLETMDITAMGMSSQLVLVVMFLLILKCEHYKQCSTPLILTALTVPIAAFVGIDLYQTIYGQPIHLFDAIPNTNIERPFYIVVAIIWTVIAISIQRFRDYIFPPFTKNVFFGYAVIANIIIAVTPPEQLDLYSAMAHALKLAGYYTIVIMYLISKFQFDMVNRINTSNNIYTLPHRN